MEKESERQRKICAARMQETRETSERESLEGALTTFSCCEKRRPVVGGCWRKPFLNIFYEAQGERGMERERMTGTNRREIYGDMMSSTTSKLQIKS